MVKEYDKEQEIGFRFDPSDEELIINYLQCKVANKPNPDFELEDKDDLYKKEPWRLHHTKTDAFEPNQWYYFVKRTQISGNDTGIQNKLIIRGETCQGYWKADGCKKLRNHAGKNRQVIGKKRNLSFYVKGEKTEKASGWTMTEYYLHGSGSIQNQVLCHLKGP